jgi:biotin operon repressor
LKLQILKYSSKEVKIKIKKIKRKGIKFEIKTKQEGKYHSNQGRNQKQI